MADAGGNDLWKAIVAAIPGVGALGWAIFNKLGDKEKSHIVIAHERDDEDAAATARATLDDAQKEWFDGMRSDLRDARSEIAALRKDRDRGWDLARTWSDCAHHERQARNNLLMPTGQSIEPLPNLEEIDRKEPQ